MKRLLIAALIALAVLAAACGDGDEYGGAASAPDQNDADIAFAQGMIPHHAQAVEMSQLVADRADSDEVKDLAERIEQAQAPEIEQMNGFLGDWGVESGGGAHGGGHGGGGGHPGMLNEDELGQLEAASGADFDRLFLEGMIRHHEGAVTASQKELEDGASDDAKALASQIIAAQEAEIAKMETLLSAS